MLKKITYSKPLGSAAIYPFNLAWLEGLEQIEFKQPLTFFVGDNGIGKSTLIQALAIHNQIPQLTNELYEDNPEFKTILQLANCLTSQWDVKSKKGFFFRADDFISFVRSTKKLKKELQEELALLDEREVPAQAYERHPYQNSLAALERTYPRELQTLSHGQSFLALFQQRLAPQSLYILDEPEIPLSPQNQLTLLYLIHEQIQQGSQFIIASHSPILTAYPGAEIYKLTEERLAQIDYEEIENVEFMTNFMADPQRFMYYTFQQS